MRKLRYCKIKGNDPIFPFKTNLDHWTPKINIRYISISGPILPCWLDPPMGIIHVSELHSPEDKIKLNHFDYFKGDIVPGVNLGCPT